MSLEIIDSMKKDEQFQICLPFIFEEEGGYVNDPVDPGGETKYGISKRSFPELNIKDLTKEQAAIIYYRNYWLRGPSGLKWPLNLVMFDCSVNQGTGRSREFLKISKEDWKKFIELRREHYLKLVEKNPRLNRFIRGWLGRLNRLRKFIDEKAA